MELDNETVKKIAFLSRLNVDDNIEGTKSDFRNIFGLIEQFNSVDTSQISPLVSVNENNVICREDKITEGGNAGAVLSNAPQSEFNYFIVPRVVD